MPCYWVDDVRSNAFDLPIGATSGEALSIYVEGSTVYSGGFTYKTTIGTAKPCYWEGTTLKDLPLPTDAVYGVVSAIYVSGNTVYTAGYIYKGTKLPCYWVNQSGPTTLHTNLGKATGIQVVNGKTYIAGWYAVYPCFWTLTNDNKGLPVGLPGPAGSNGGKTTSIYVSGSTIYLAGWYQMDSGNQEFPCYWNGNTGVWTKLPTVPAVTSEAKANAIFVK